jgi:hypothetical protein
MDDLDLDSLTSVLRASWSADTASGAWNRRVPAAGQCAVTALVVQDLLGGDLVRGSVQGVSHYWNRLPDRDVDCTREQFSTFVLDEPPATRDRAYVLSFPDTAVRYERLRARVLASLQISVQVDERRSIEASRPRELPAKRVA